MDYKDKKPTGELMCRVTVHCKDKSYRILDITDHCEKRSISELTQLAKILEGQNYLSVDIQKA